MENPGLRRHGETQPFLKVSRRKTAAPPPMTTPHTKTIDGYQTGITDMYGTQREDVTTPPPLAGGATSLPVPATNGEMVQDRTPNLEHLEVWGSREVWGGAPETQVPGTGRQKMAPPSMEDMAEEQNEAAQQRRVDTQKMRGGGSMENPAWEEAQDRINQKMMLRRSHPLFKGASEERACPFCGESLPDDDEAVNQHYDEHHNDNDEMQGRPAYRQTDEWAGPKTDSQEVPEARVKDYQYRRGLHTDFVPSTWQLHPDNIHKHNHHDPTQDIADVLAVQGTDGNWNYDPYMHGMYNGMELVGAIHDRRDPQFRDAPEHWLSKDAAAEPELQVEDYSGREGNNDHITRNERGMVPVDWVRNMPGYLGERPGEHRNAQGDEWEQFKAHVAAGTPGYSSPLFIMVMHGKEPRLAEGNHRRDAYVENGATHVPVEIRYFGHAERQGTVGERAAMQKQAASSLGDRAGGPQPHDVTDEEHQAIVNRFPAGMHWNDYYYHYGLDNEGRGLTLIKFRDGSQPPNWMVYTHGKGGRAIGEQPHTLDSMMDYIEQRRNKMGKKSKLGMYEDEEPGEQSPLFIDACPKCGSAEVAARSGVEPHREMGCYDCGHQWNDEDFVPRSKPKWHVETPNGCDEYEVDHPKQAWRKHQQDFGATPGEEILGMHRAENHPGYTPEGENRFPVREEGRLWHGGQPINAGDYTYDYIAPTRDLFDRLSYHDVRDDLGRFAPSGTRRREDMKIKPGKFDQAERELGSRTKALAWDRLRRENPEVKIGPDESYAAHYERLKAADRKKDPRKRQHNRIKHHVGLANPGLARFDASGDSVASLQKQRYAAQVSPDIVHDPATGENVEIPSNWEVRPHPLDEHATPSLDFEDHRNGLHSLEYDPRRKEWRHHHYPMEDEYGDDVPRHSGPTTHGEHYSLAEAMGCADVYGDHMGPSDAASWSPWMSHEAAQVPSDDPVYPYSGRVDEHDTVDPENLQSGDDRYRSEPDLGTSLSDSDLLDLVHGPSTGDETPEEERAAEASRGFLDMARGMPRAHRDLRAEDLPDDLVDRTTAEDVAEGVNNLMGQVDPDNRAPAGGGLSPAQKRHIDNYVEGLKETHRQKVKRLHDDWEARGGHKTGEPRPVERFSPRFTRPQAIVPMDGNPFPELESPIYHVGKCEGCGRNLFDSADSSGDPRGALGDYTAGSIDAAEYDANDVPKEERTGDRRMHGPSALICPMCENDENRYNRVLDRYRGHKAGERTGGGDWGWPEGADRSDWSARRFIPSTYSKDKKGKWHNPGEKPGECYECDHGIEGFHRRHEPQPGS